MDYISIIKEYHNNNKDYRNWKNQLVKILNTHPEKYREFVSAQFSFMYNPSDQQVIWHVLNDNYVAHTCENCSKPVKFNRQFFYHRLCSKKCTALFTAKNMSNEDKDKIVKKREDTCIKKYGKRYASMTDECKKKKKKTSLEKYGVENAMQCKEVHDRQFKTMQETNMERYGAKSTLGLESTREKYTETMKKRYGVEHGWNNPIIFKKVQNTMLEKYGVLHYGKSNDWYERFKNHEWGNKYKDYTTPNGTNLRIQGYENFALDQLFKNYSEEDIVVNKINSVIGKIQYVLNTNKKIYKPDIYIKSEHKIIEVKSQFTYDLQLEKNKLKAQACLNLGFQFEFWIIDRKDTIKIKTPDIF